MRTFTTIHTPLGELSLTAEDGALTGLKLPGAPEPRDHERDDATLPEVRSELEAYFAGEAIAFSTEPRMRGSAFERRVWREVAAIPCGETASYGEIARRIGHPDGARAVGLANARNPVAIIVPCHRVIGSDGSLTGYAGGLERKRWLLDHEAGVTALPLAH